MHTELYILVKNDPNIPNSVTGGQGNALLSKHLVKHHVPKFFRVKQKKLSFTPAFFMLLLWI